MECIRSIIHTNEYILEVIYIEKEGNYEINKDLCGWI